MHDKANTPVREETGGRIRSNAEDICLIAQFLHGNETAFEKLFRKYQQPLFAVCYRFLGSASEAEDVLQESFLDIYSSLQSFRGESAFMTWAYRITVRKCLERVHKLKKQRTIQLELITPGAGGQPDIEKLCLRQALAKLPDHFRVVLVLKYYQQLSNEDIAGILGCSVGQIKMRLNRARNSLREVLCKIERGEIV